MRIAPAAFVRQVMNALFLKDVLVGLVKSVSFAWMITLIAVYRGLRFSGGAAGVGRATTAAVVSSIFGIIVLDCFWGLLFYLK
jgi:phospholipid/cholesterol/gamma-HCH transport system permease protein